MITLDSTLASAQNSLNRNSIISINSTAFSETIPFEGNMFNSLTDIETHADMFLTSTNKIAAVFERNNKLYLLITNAEKTEWFEYQIYSGSSIYVSAITELTNGNFGVAVIDKPWSYRLSTLIINDTGQVVSGTNILLNTNYWISGISVAYTGTEYLLVYAYKDGADQYSIQKMTSSDFITWSSNSTLSISGLNPVNNLDHLAVRVLSSGELVILFDYLEGMSGSEELRNVYWTQSTDGITWATASKLTNYTIYGTVGKHPSIAERLMGDIVISFQEEKDVLTMTSSTVGWEGGETRVVGLTFDQSTGKLLFKTGYTGTGWKNFKGAMIADASSWIIEEAYTSTSSPPLSYGTYGTQWDSYDSGKWMVWHKDRIIAVLHVETEVFRYYVYEDEPAYGLTKNIDITPTIPGYSGLRIIGDRLYIDGFSNYAWYNWLGVGYIDLTIELDPVTGMYDSWTRFIYWNYGFGIYATHQPFGYYPDEDIFIKSSAHTLNDRLDVYLSVFNSAGARTHHFDAASYPGFPARGMAFPILVDNHIYGDIEYEANYGNGGRYGLADIDLDTLEIKYHRPTWATYNNYNLGRGKDMGDGRILFAVEPWGGGYGITIFDIATTSWTLYSYATLPGLTGTAYWYVDYDPIEKIIYAGGYHGLVAFSEDGEFSEIQYMEGTKDTGSWVFTAADTLIYGQNNLQSTIAIDEVDVLWAIATKKHSGGEHSLIWDSELAEKDLTPFLTDSAVTLKWDVDSINSLSFTLSHGHLFDPSNTMSVINPFVKKGRKIEISLGETVNGIDYLQQQGKFIVNETSLSYEKDKYPTININCEDYRSIWKQNRIVTSMYYSNQIPTDVITDLIETFTTTDPTDISLPSIYNSHNIYHQFIDQDLPEMLDSIAEHFNYFFYVNMYGKYTMKRFNLSQSIHHTYAGQELINYTPDDTFSSFVNRVIVKGEGRYEIEVLYPVELITEASGTVGWWGGNEVVRVHYSEDREKRCRNPYLEVKTSVSEFEIFIMQGGGSESITNTDSNEYWVEITIECPDLTGFVIALAVAILAVGIAAMGCGSWTGPCGPYIFALSILLQLLGYALGSIAQYHYEIWANPIGYSKQTFQASADDLEFQRQLDGLVVKEEVDDPFCYDIGRCQVVADNELAIVMAQRKRISFKKIAHLQDEIGDTIQIQHPYTNTPTNIFATSLQRTYQKKVGVFDSIEGWVII